MQARFVAAVLFVLLGWNCAWSSEQDDSWRLRQQVLDLSHIAGRLGTPHPAAPGRLPLGRHVLWETQTEARYAVHLSIEK
jgi:hypothetical protein